MSLPKGIQIDMQVEEGLAPVTEVEMALCALVDMLIERPPRDTMQMLTAEHLAALLSVLANQLRQAVDNFVIDLDAPEARGEA